MIRRGKRRPSFSPPPVVQNRRAPLSVLENTMPSTKNYQKSHSKENLSVFNYKLDFNYKSEILENMYLNQIQNDMLQEIVQSGITTEMRCQLVEWMISLCFHFHTTRDVLFTAVSILDQALCKLHSDKENLQLLGASCIHIAVKLQSTYVLDTHQLSKQCANAYTPQDIQRTEMEVLRALDFNITTPTVYDFLSIHEPLFENHAPFNSLVWFIAALQLQFSSFLRFKVSTVATAILVYCAHCFDEPIGQPCLIKLAQREDWKELFMCIEELCRVLMEIIGKMKTSVLENLKKKEFSKMKKMVGIPSIIDFEDYFSLYPNLKLF